MRAGGTVVAADIASGVAADSGRVLGRAVRADRTVTFSLAKAGQFIGDGALCSGSVEVRDIGIPADLWRGTVCPVQTTEVAFVREALPPRKADGHKGTFGKVLIVGGSEGLYRCPLSHCLRRGAQRLRTGVLGVPERIWQVEASGASVPCRSPCRTNAESSGPMRWNRWRKSWRAAGVGAGAGPGAEPGVTELVCALLQRATQPVVLDADGINALSEHIDVLKERRGRITILTPHDGEFARLGGDLSSGDRLAAARAFAREYGCTLVLKGHRTLTATRRGPYW